MLNLRLQQNLRRVCGLCLSSNVFVCLFVVVVVVFQGTNTFIVFGSCAACQLFSPPCRYKCLGSDATNHKHFKTAPWKCSRHCSVLYSVGQNHESHLWRLCRRAFFRRVQETDSWTEKKKLSYLTFALHHTYGIKMQNWKLQIKAMAEQDALNEFMQMLETTPDSSKPILVSLSPPNKFQKNVWSWLFLFPRANRTRHLFPNLRMKRWNAFQTERLKKIANGMRPTMTGRQLRLCLPAKPLVWLSKWMTKKLCKKTWPDLKISLLTLIVLCGWIYGTALHCLLVVSNAAMITTKHADFEPENGPEKEPDKELQKLFTMLYKTWKRKLTHLLKFQGKLCQRFLQQNLQKSWPSCGWKLFSWTKPPCTWGKKIKENTTAAPTEQKQTPTAESDSWKVNA